MLVAGAVCVCTAIVVAAFGMWSLVRKPAPNPTAQAVRAMAPTQLASAAILAAGGVVALAAPTRAALVVLILSILGALATLVAGSLQGAHFALRREAAARSGAAEGEGSCTGCCEGCTQSCE
ncbi:hypothetical protein [Mycobacterium sp.]|uniref:hypothetical protein n=1 Tax=Mycobacterium sp. TaxID=1785 RepID=UPI003A86097B